MGSRFTFLFRGEPRFIQADSEASYEHITAKCAKTITTYREPDAGPVD